MNVPLPAAPTPPVRLSTLSGTALVGPCAAAIVVLCTAIIALGTGGVLGVEAAQPLETSLGQTAPTATPPPEGDPFRFRSGVELINVTATVSDGQGRFVPNLSQDDFVIYEDNRPQTITYFSAERVPVSLGIVLDTSGSMAGEKIEAARAALNRFLFDLLDEGDEVFLYRFSDDPTLLQGWTSDRAMVSHALGRIAPHGGTALYDAVAEAIPLAREGSNRKKALLIVSDGNDTMSRIGLRDLKQQIRESEVLVYAIGIDGESAPAFRQSPPRAPLPPFRRPFPPTRGGRGRFPLYSPAGPLWQPQLRFPGPSQPRFPGQLRGDDRVDARTLRELTDDSGGRTEVVRETRDLNPATASIADELSQQYFIGYPAIGHKDGRWHAIRVETRDRSYRVRARRGYVAN
jgi:Ca-activated chloride channel family protein